MFPALHSRYCSCPSIKSFLSTMYKLLLAVLAVLAIVAAANAQVLGGYYGGPGYGGLYRSGYYGGYASPYGYGRGLYGYYG